LDERRQTHQSAAHHSDDETVQRVVATGRFGKHAEGQRGGQGVGDRKVGRGGRHIQVFAQL